MPVTVPVSVSVCVCGRGYVRVRLRVCISLKRHGRRSQLPLPPAIVLLARSYLGERSADHKARLYHMEFVGRLMGMVLSRGDHLNVNITGYV